MPSLYLPAARLYPFLPGECARALAALRGVSAFHWTGHRLNHFPDDDSRDDYRGTPVTPVQSPYIEVQRRHDGWRARLRLQAGIRSRPHQLLADVPGGLRL